jgi:hypothetical protein
MFQILRFGLLEHTKAIDVSDGLGKQSHNIEQFDIYPFDIWRIDELFIPFTIAFI